MALNVQKEENVITFSKAKLTTRILAPDEELTVRCKKW
jgi:hypothetical protein